MSVEKIKKSVGEAAAKLIQDGMVVGLGTGTTSHYFIECLGKLCDEGLRIKAIASSNVSMLLGMRCNIPMISSEEVTHLDITVDGADEIDSEKHMIKGGGGALLREKIVAQMSRELIIIVDESKLSHELGKKKLPVEIIPFAYAATEKHIRNLGYVGSLRKEPSGIPLITDNGNFIIDIKIPHGKKVKDVHEELVHLPGVLETGFFSHLTGRVIVGFFDGQIVIRP